MRPHSHPSRPRPAHAPARVRVRVWVLGASDPEMAAIEAMLRERGEAVAYAAETPPRGGNPIRVTPGSAYRATHILGAPPPGGAEAAATTVVVEVVWVEAGGSPGLAERWLGVDDDVVHHIRCDHHRPGDPGYGRPPGEFWGASSIGQVAGLLGVAPTPRLRVAAAADHCLSAAYAGQCPGVAPGAVREYRRRERAEWLAAGPRAATAAACEAIAQALGGAPPPRGDVRAWEAAVEAAWVHTGTRIAAAPRVELAPGVSVADTREEALPELPEVAAQCGVAVLYRLVPPPGARDPRPKVGVIGAGAGTRPGEAPIRAFLGGWARAAGLADIYGDPARGYAGGYEPV